MADQLHPLSHVARTVLGDEAPSPATLWRWTAKGVSGVKLPVTRVGRRAFLSEHTFRKWLSDITAAQRCVPPGESTSPSVQSRLVQAGLMEVPDES